jgi:hypothetical protein
MQLWPCVLVEKRSDFLNLGTDSTRLFVIQALPTKWAPETLFDL